MLDPTLELLGGRYFAIRGRELGDQSYCGGRNPISEWMRLRPLILEFALASGQLNNRTRTQMTVYKAERMLWKHSHFSFMERFES
jgi:hypothetical protein